TTNIENNSYENQPTIKNYPNPVSDYTVFEISNNADYYQDIYIEIFDIKGNYINKLLIKDKLIWNRKDFNNNLVKNGIYLYKLNTINSTAKKILLIKSIYYEKTYIINYVNSGIYILLFFPDR
ncbi:MAG: T9SS type A sorting domain-containing protein, partial [Bacteroidales bacterium]|nr:T9SS type A sorting domain-containing protein [Bacteroidales bacterium]